MPIEGEQIINVLKDILKYKDAERGRLDNIHDYLLDIQPHPATPVGIANEVKRLANIARVPLMEIVVSSVAQSLYIDGYRKAKAAEDAEAWNIWQLNQMDARQGGVHRSTLSYGTAYVLVLPGEPVPVIRGYSPRRMCVLYEEDIDDWPVYALREDEVADNKFVYRLYDDQNVHIIDSTKIGNEREFTVRETKAHNVGKCPVVRFVCSHDLDEDNVGEVEPLMALQDQVNVTTFELMVAQHYGAFRQRYAIGWTAASETELLKANASQLWTFEDGPSDVQLGEFAQTDLSGYLTSREASLRHAATLSQTPVHELIGQMINLSAEALVAAEAGQRRKIVERQVSMGESWEQVLMLASEIGKIPLDTTAEVRWRDTESRSLAATVDALGKMAEMLGIPPQALWERIPNVSQADIERWKEMAKDNDALATLTAMLDGQTVPANNENPVPEASV